MHVWFWLGTAETKGPFGRDSCVREKVKMNSKKKKRMPGCGVDPSGSI
jgi:hypothetical protein